jgi:hypothetical protein
MIRCPACRKQIPDVITHCEFCGKELNSTEKIRKLVTQVDDCEKKCKRIHKRLNEMNLLFSKVIKWNYNQRIMFRKLPYEELNILIHEWQKEKANKNEGA